ncbi:unnamed protein product [Sphagnum balticum]
MAEVGSPGSQDSPHSDDYGNNQGGGDRNNSSVREQDRFLPIANISRIMKKALPANAKIAKDAKETIQECVSEFISFITSEASDKCQREKRKTINGDDLLWAMSTLGFEEYVEPLKVYLHKYREDREKVRERLAAAHNVKGDIMSHKVSREMKINTTLPSRNTRQVHVPLHVQNFSSGLNNIANSSKG